MRGRNLYTSDNYGSEQAFANWNEQKPVHFIFITIPPDTAGAVCRRGAIPHTASAGECFYFFFGHTVLRLPEKMHRPSDVGFAAYRTGRVPRHKPGLVCQRVTAPR